jgi:hypothetical protein
MLWQSNIAPARTPITRGDKLGIKDLQTAVETHLPIDINRLLD